MPANMAKGYSSSLIRPLDIARYLARLRLQNRPEKMSSPIRLEHIANDCQSAFAGRMTPSRPDVVISGSAQVRSNAAPLAFWSNVTLLAGASENRGALLQSERRLG